MGTIRIGINTTPPEGAPAEFRHYEFWWEGDAEQAAASMRLFEDEATKLGGEPERIARGLLHQLYHLLAELDDLKVAQKAAIVWYTLRLPTPPDGSRSVLERISREDFLVELDAFDFGDGRGEIKSRVQVQPAAH